MSKSGWIADVPVGATNSKSDTPLFPFLNRLTRGEDLSVDESSEFFRALTDLNANPAQVAGCLVALASKGETFGELAGMARVMRERAVKIAGRQKNLIDITGTGSSPAKTFNISTAAAFVAAAAGLSVAKHGNRAVASRSGSADVLAKLGVKVSSEPEVAQTSLSGAGICFMFGPKFHPTLRRVGDIRRALGIRTSLNLLGVLANPANPHKRLLGVWHASLIRPIAEALALLGTERSWVVHGSDSLDELTINGSTTVIEVMGNKLREFQVSPSDFKINAGKIEQLRTNSAEQSAVIIRDVLSSKRRDEARSLVVINAAAALVIGGITKDPVHAARLAEQAIDSGQAQNKLDRLIQATNKR
jgi:anthranilate phosphoribosyltransferase